MRRGNLGAKKVNLSHVYKLLAAADGQPPDTIAKHRQIARLSSQGRHMVATRSGHWIQFDQPDVVVDAIREMVARARQSSAA